MAQHSVFCLMPVAGSVIYLPDWRLGFLAVCFLANAYAKTSGHFTNGYCPDSRGAIGNLIDRVSLGYVVDFIHVYYQNSHFPAFNIADSAITLGTILLLIDTFFLEKHRIQRAEATK